MLSAVLCLSTKYEVTYLRTRIIRDLCSTFPTKLDQWRLRDAYLVEYFDWRPLAVVLLAKEMDIPAVLPAALCSFTTGLGNLNDILAGTTLPDGSTLSLDRATADLCVVAREQLGSRVRDTLLKSYFEGDAADNCQTADHCNMRRINTLRLYEKTPNTLVPHPFLLEMLSFRPNIQMTGVCGACIEEAEATFDDEQNKLWEELPSFFNLPPWEELRATLLL